MQDRGAGGVQEPCPLANMGQAVQGQGVSLTEALVNQTKHCGKHRSQSDKHGVKIVSVSQGWS